jgi:hypothetical protein
VTQILINRQLINWPKPTITEDQLREYADAPTDHDIWQENLTGAAKVTGVADLRLAQRFYSAPSIINGG